MPVCVVPRDTPARGNFIVLQERKLRPREDTGLEQTYSAEASAAELGFRFFSLSVHFVSVNVQWCWAL